MKGDILTLKLSYKTELLICHHLQSKQIRRAFMDILYNQTHILYKSALLMLGFLK